MMKHLLLLCLFPTMMATAETVELTKQLGKTVLYGDIALSPDGQHVAWVQSSAATTTKETYILTGPGKDSATKVNLKLPSDVPSLGERTDFDPVWSPDSKWLTFFSTAVMQGGQRQLWRVSTDGSQAQLTTAGLVGYAARPRWSHDGKRIAFLYIENAGGGGPLTAAPTTTGVIDTAIHNQRIAVLNTQSGEVRQISPTDLHIYDFDWSPDDKAFVVTAAPGPGDNNWWVARIYKIDIGSGAATSIYKPTLQVATPRWSPDGKSIAFIEGLMSDEGFHGGDLFTVSTTGKSLTNHTKGRKSSVSSFFWPTADHVVVIEYVGGGTAISELTLTDNSVRSIWHGAEGLHAFGNFPNFALSVDGKVATAVRGTYDTPPEIWTGALDQLRQVTRNNASLTRNWGTAENLEWTNEGFNIQGWLIAPAKVEAGKKYPLVVLIHGGPSSVTTPDWPAGAGMSRAIIAALSTSGYYILLPNPRGSYGQGEDFTRANVKDFGGGDLRDTLAGIDAAAKKYPIDADRLGVTGWSYGGFMTMWTVTQTDRFRAAVAGAGIANWQSYYGQNLIDQWMIPFFGASVYDDPPVYEKSSPIHFIKKVKTPTLVVVGERDAECPTPQSYEFWHALKTLHVPTQLIIYPGEGHMFIKPENQADRLDQTIAWFDKYLKP